MLSGLHSGHQDDHDSSVSITRFQPTPPPKYSRSSVQSPMLPWPASSCSCSCSCRRPGTSSHTTQASAAADRHANLATSSTRRFSASVNHPQLRAHRKLPQPSIPSRMQTTKPTVADATPPIATSAATTAAAAALRPSSTSSTNHLNHPSQHYAASLDHLCPRWYGLPDLHQRTHDLKNCFGR